MQTCPLFSERNWHTVNASADKKEYLARQEITLLYLVLSAAAVLLHLQQHHCEGIGRSALSKVKALAGSTLPRETTS